MDRSGSLKQYIGAVGSAINAESDGEVVRRLLKEVGRGDAKGATGGDEAAASALHATVQPSLATRPRFIFGQLRDVHAAQEAETAAASDGGGDVADALCALATRPARSSAELAAEAKLVQRVLSMHQAAAAGTLVMVVCGQGNMALCGALFREQAARRAAAGAPAWSPEHDHALEMAALRARTGFCWATVKTGAAEDKALEPERPVEDA